MVNLFMAFVSVNLASSPFLSLSTCAALVQVTMRASLSQPAKLSSAAEQTVDILRERYGKHAKRRERKKHHHSWKLTQACKGERERERGRVECLFANYHGLH